MKDDGEDEVHGIQIQHTGQNQLVGRPTKSVKEEEEECKSLKEEEEECKSLKYLPLSSCLFLSPARVFLFCF